MRVFLNICLLLEECNLIFFKVLFGMQKISNKFYLKVLRINFNGCYDYSYFGFFLLSYIRHI